jgi:hypothetical protein
LSLGGWSKACGGSSLSLPFPQSGFIDHPDIKSPHFWGLHSVFKVPSSLGVTLSLQSSFWPSRTPLSEVASQVPYKWLRPLLFQWDAPVRLRIPNPPPIHPCRHTKVPLIAEVYLSPLCSSIPSDSPSRLHSLALGKSKVWSSDSKTNAWSFSCNVAWLIYKLLNQEVWLLNRTLNYSTSLQLDIFWHNSSKWSEVPYVQDFMSISWNPD